MSAPNNYTVQTILAYSIFCYVPHIYSSTLLKAPADIKAKDPNTKLKPGDTLYHFANPRGGSARDYYAKVLDKRTFQRWERARSAHHNMLESAPFVVGSLIIGLVAKLPASYMNAACASYLLTRVAYLFAYIGTERGLITTSRTATFIMGHVVLCAVMWQSSKKLMVGEY